MTPMTRASIVARPKFFLWCVALWFCVVGGVRGWSLQKVVDYYILVQTWRPGVITSDDIEKRIVVWIRIINLPIELYNS